MKISSNIHLLYTPQRPRIKLRNYRKARCQGALAAADTTPIKVCLICGKRHHN